MLWKIFSIMLLIVVMGSGSTYAFADHMQAGVEIAPGSNVPGCEANDKCFIPHEVTVDAGGEVTWTNGGTEPTTVTSGTATAGPDGLFDSGLLAPGSSFSFKFETPGVFHYFSMIHPWMNGMVTVTEMSADTTGTTVKVDGTDFVLSYKITGGSVISVTPDIDANSLITVIKTTGDGQLTMTFPRALIDSKINGEDDDFFIIIDGEEKDFQETTTSTDRTLTIGFPDGAEEIEIIGTSVVPEFGTIAVMILGVAIISIIAVTAKSRVIPKL
jgi:predicted secreted protein with PEFG-CTERM motif